MSVWQGHAVQLCFLWQGRAVHQDLQGLLFQAAFQLGSSLHILMLGVVLPRVQDCALLVEHEVPVSPFLQTVKVPLDGSRALW